MPIIFIAENNEYNPLELEPYKSFNKKFEDREDDLEGALIKISIPNHRKGFVDGFSIDRYYCDDITLKFIFSHIYRSSSENSILIHHTIEYDFDTSFDVSDQRSLDEIVNWLMGMGDIPSFWQKSLNQERNIFIFRVSSSLNCHIA